MKIKIHKSYRDVVAICDKDLVGKKFEQGNLQLDVKESFFNGKEVSEKEAMEILIDMAKEDATFNIIGPKSVKTALKCGLIQQEGIKTIQEIPFALVLM
jgi:uncharacterized protein